MDKIIDYTILSTVEFFLDITNTSITKLPINRRTIYIGGVILMSMPSGYTLEILY